GIARLEDLEPLLGTSLKGSVSGSLALRPGGKRTYTQLALDARNVIAAGIPVEARLSGSGTTEATDLQLRLQSANLRGEPADLESKAYLDLRSRELRLDQLLAHYHSQSLSLLSPAHMSFAEGFAVRGLKLGMQKAIVEVDGKLSPLDLRANARHIDADLIKAFMPGLLAQGSFDLEAQLTGTTSAPSGLVKLTGTQLRASSAQDLQPIDLHASAHLMETTAQLDVRLDGGHDSQLGLTGAAPLDPQGTLNLRVNGKLDAARANPLLAARGERLGGAVTLDATVKGTLRSPEIQGTADLAHGDARDYVQGAHLSNISAHLTANGGTLRIESLVAHAGPGQLSLTGQVDLMQPALPLSARLTAKNAQPVTSDILNANLDADVKVAGTLRERLDVTGTLQVNRAVIGIPNALPPQVAVLDVRRPGEAPPPPPARQLVIGLDLTLHAPREVRVQGRGLNAELGGTLHITGTTADPVVNGGFNMIRGTFALASTRLDFTHGRVSFTGTGLSGKLDPTLDFTAQATVTDSTVTLHITGLADSPQFELSSTPPLPQDEILARLLFGESASQLSALQIAQIGAALASLSGVGGSGPNPLARVQKALGLDVLSVESGNSGGTQGSQSTGTRVEAGRYVSNHVFVAARESTTGFSQVEVDVDLSKHLKLQTRLGNGTATTQGITPENDPGSSVGMVYQFQY
ncbi:MAG: translocation/assembly module TamB domain-containing protein, partial [Sinobacteraceae bacterium]|nr:translocation/assembly module TamB domain-containing protein [Nevskiaceae bacterium]MBV9316257.1 translocation/assembly module TamB domain-containing protein [Gammaproteobacteria bacterium]